MSRPGYRRLLVALALTGIILACGRSAPEGQVTALADEYLEAFFHRFPEVPTDYGIPGQPHERLTDLSQEARVAWENQEDQWLEALDAVGTTPISHPEWAIGGLLRETLEASSAIRVCRTDLWSVSQTSGWQTHLPLVFDVQPLGTEELRRQALARAHALPGYLAADIANLREGLRLGYSSPRRSIRLTLRQLEALGSPGSPFASPLARDDDPGFGAEYQSILDEEIYPAIEAYKTFLQEEYLPAARSEISVAANPNGAECYRALIRYHSTLRLEPEEIHELGLEQMARITNEMRAIGERSFETDDVGQLLARVTTEPEFTFSSRKEIIEFSEAAYQRAREAMPDFFGRMPEADVVIEPYPPYLEATGTGEYWAPAEDGSRPGTYYIPVTDPGNRPIVIYESLAFHETIPGHHLQIAIALELGEDAHPLARYLYNSGFGEGWGLYSERLADEMGLYSSDLTRLGMLGDQAARAARLVVDTGMHELGWTRQQAIDYMVTNTTWTPTDVAAEVDRYIVWPGQATAYMLGMLKIMELRERAAETLGDAFAITEFHDRLLENGAISLSMLEETIDAWVRNRPR